MDISTFTSLGRDEQFAEAGKIAGVKASVFDGIWRTESGRGAAMLSPAGARGHFGLMPTTQKTMERRFGATVDPDNFGQSLFTAAHLLKENLGRFKNLPDALRAYNGGWNPKTWGNKETAAYAGKVLGNDEEYTVPDESTAEAVESGAVGRLAKTPAMGFWDTPFAAAGKTPAKEKSTVSKATQALLDGKGAIPIGATPSAFTQADATATAYADQQLKVIRDRENTSFLDASRALAFDTVPVRTMIALARDPEPVDLNFVVPEEAYKGRSAEDQREISTASSQRQLDRILFDLDYQKEQHEIGFRNGTLFGLGAQFLAMAPEAVATGGLASLAFKGVGVGSLALAQAGSKGGALASSFAEGVAGNVLNTVALDSLNVRQGADSYALAVLGGVLNPILAGRYIGRTADAAAEGANMRRLLVEAGEREQARIAEATKRLGPDATPEDMAAMVNTIEAEQLRAQATAHTAQVPESRKFNVGATDDTIADATKVVEKADELAANELRVDPNKEVDLALSARNAAWDSPTFLADRQMKMQLNPEWQAAFNKQADGIVKWDEVKDLADGVYVSPQAAADVTLRKPIADLQELAKVYGVKKVIITDKVATSAEANGSVISHGGVHVIGLRPGVPSPTGMKHTAWHELGHAIYQEHAAAAPAELMARIDGDWRQFATAAMKRDPKAWEQRWALTSPNRDAKSLSQYAIDKNEYMAEQFVKHLENAALSGRLGGQVTPGVIKGIVDAVSALWNYVADLVRMGHLKPGKAADEFFSQVLEGGFAKTKQAEQFLAPDMRLPELGELAQLDTAIPPALSKDVNDFLNDPVVLRNGLDRLPMGTAAQRAEAKAMRALYERAESPQYVVDEKRLNSILKRFGSLDPTSNIMLRSKNPVVRMAAIELLENGGGAAGRRSTASIAKYMNERAIVGDSIVSMDQAFRGWAKGQPGFSAPKEAFSGEARARFNRLVAEEIEQRRYPDAQTDFGPNVRAAADAVEGSFERARLMQVDAKVAGWAALPETSRGYMPHRIKSSTYRTLSLPQKRALHSELTDQFVSISGYDPTFADQLASKYLDRVEHRALGGFDAPVGLHQTGAADVVREALEAMDMTRDQVDAMMGRYVKGAAAHTKKRLNIDLRKQITAEDGSTFSLMDLYDTDMLSLMRSQSQRVSGEVALARHGVYGKPGLAIMRRAMGYGPGEGTATKAQLEAFDQVSAEFLGQPFGTTHKWVDRATQFNSLASLGGMGFNQMGEIINVASTLGVKAALSHVASFGRLSREVRQLAKGQKIEGSLLQHIETMGGAEFGTDAYKMVFPLDNPDLFANSIGADSIPIGDKLLRAGIHAQGILSGWRVLHATQVRATAEQIVLRTARAMKEGATDFHMRDMGIDDDMLKRLSKDMHHIVQMRDGKVTAFDITKATDKEAASAYIQAVHRGASQMIQGTFIGETGSYVHNSWLRMMTQFRTFSLTAIDKQWNRQVGNRGMIGATLVTLAAMSAAAPLYMTRTYLASIGRKDQDEYLDKHLQFGAIARATTNYIATSGLAGDFLDATTALTGTGEWTGGRSGTASTFTGNIIAPAAGKVDKIWGAVQNTREGTDPKALLRELPMARLPFVIPAMNALTD